VKHFTGPKLLLVVGVLFVLTGTFLSIRVPVLSSQHTYEIGPGGISPDSVDIPLGIFYGESVSVIVEFDSSTSPDDCLVWALVNYQYPTKGISEAAIRLEGQREMSFTLGWENTGFLVRIFYFGTESVSVDVSITRFGNPVTLTGLGLLVILTVIILKTVITKQVGKR
jgi:hypothetical protein